MEENFEFFHKMAPLAQGVGLLFSLELDHLELYDYFLSKKGQCKWPPKMSRHQILYSNETFL
jgi:hypothetical protein